MTGPQMLVAAVAALIVLSKVYVMGKRDGIAIATWIIRDGLLNGPGLVSAKAIAEELNKGLKAMGKQP